MRETEGVEGARDERKCQEEEEVARGGSQGERLEKQQNEGEVGVVGSEYQMRTLKEGAADERAKVNIIVLVACFLKPPVFHQFHHIDSSILAKKTFKLGSPLTHTRIFLFLTIPLFLLASILSFSSLTPTTCDFLCFLDSFSPVFPPPQPPLLISGLMQHQWIVSPFPPPTRIPSPTLSPRVSPSVLFKTTN